MCGEKWGHIKNGRGSKLEKTEADREHRSSEKQDKLLRTDASWKINSTLKSLVIWPPKGSLRACLVHLRSFAMIHVSNGSK